MNIIYRILLLTTIFYGKIICDDAEPAGPNYDLTIYVNDIPPLQIESKNIHEDKISEICKQIHDELNKDENIQRFCVENPNLNVDNLKDIFKDIKEKYTLEKYKKKDGDDDTYNYFLEFYEASNSYDDIEIKKEDLANIKEIYLIDSAKKNYKVIIEDSDIYNNNEVKFKDNVKNMINTIPFELEYCHKNILKTILEKNTIKENNFNITDIEIDNSKKEIKVKVNIIGGKENACYKKFTLELGLQKEVEGKDYYEYYEISKNENLFYKDFKNKYEFTLDEIKEIFKLKNTYFLIKNDKNIGYIIGNSTIGLYNTKENIIESIIYQTKDQNGNIIDEQKLKDANGNITPITVYTDYDKILDFLYDLSSLLHLNLYEHYEIYDVNGLGNSCKIKIDKDSLKSKYDVTYKVDNKDEKKELYFSEDKPCGEICRLIVGDQDVQNFILKDEGEKIFTYKDALPSSKPDKKPMQYTLEPVEKEERKQIDFTDLKKDNMEIDKNAGKDVKIINMEELIESNDELNKKNNEIEHNVFEHNNKIKGKTGCCY